MNHKLNTKKNEIDQQQKISIIITIITIVVVIIVVLSGVQGEHCIRYTNCMPAITNEKTKCIDITKIRRGNWPLCTFLFN